MAEALELLISRHVVPYATFPVPDELSVLCKTGGWLKWAPPCMSRPPTQVRWYVACRYAPGAGLVPTTTTITTTTLGVDRAPRLLLARLAAQSAPPVPCAPRWKLRRFFGSLR